MCAALGNLIQPGEEASKLIIRGKLLKSEIPPMKEKKRLPATPWARRDFLKSSAATILGLAFARLPVMA